MKAIQRGFLAHIALVTRKECVTLPLVAQGHIYNITEIQLTQYLELTQRITKNEEIEEYIPNEGTKFQN